MTPEPLLAVEDLRVHFSHPEGAVRAVDGVSWSLGAGETLGIVGESGSGKSVSALAVMGLLPPPPGCRVSGGVVFAGRDLLGAPEKELQRVRGGEISMIFQDPLTSLNPVLRVGHQVAEAVRAHDGIGRIGARRQAVDLLGEMGIPSPSVRADEYPHQFSGGMRQRAMIAMAVARNPRVLLADEPTTALDVTVQAQILELLERIQAERGMSIVLISHDLGVVAAHADRVLVMYAGRVAEVGEIERVYGRPQHAYTLGLLSSRARLDRRPVRLEPIPGHPPRAFRLPSGCAFHPRCRFASEVCVGEVPPLEAHDGEGQRAACHHADEVTRSSEGAAVSRAGLPRGAPSSTGQYLLEVENLVKHYPVTRGVMLKRRIGTVKAVDGVSFRVAEGETLGLVGESGCGKSTVARTVLRLVEPTAGTVRLSGEDVTAAGSLRLQRLRRQMQLVFQDPYASLNPRRSVGSTLTEPFVIHGVEVKGRVGELLAAVGLSAEHAGRYPHELSGGERQRVGIARALALDPKLLVLDEPVSLLDVSIQAQVVNLLEDLRSTLGLTYVVIAHDLSVVRRIADRIAVMYLGRIVELAAANALFERPSHPYTQALISSVPLPDPGKERARARVVIGGEVPSALDPPAGCPFRTRCPKFANELSEGDRQRCVEERPALVDRHGGHPSACHYAEAVGPVWLD